MWLLDAIGYMTFYHKELATEENCDYLLSASHAWEKDTFLLWKLLLCLSAFSCEKSICFIRQFIDDCGPLGLQARRSLQIIQERMGKEKL